MSTSSTGRTAGWVEYVGPVLAVAAILVLAGWWISRSMAASRSRPVPPEPPIQYRLPGQAPDRATR